ncbi:MAG: hypothetical protein BAJALOKI2v1_10035 [Promethearchaeota archaeon]|nr:MAG: hypothetical protein BAJALOKI2v1_10035 [Candidatus Lokiarchaeota archaeon]
MIFKIKIIKILLDSLLSFILIKVPIPLYSTFKKFIFQNYLKIYCEKRNVERTQL